MKIKTRLKFDRALVWLEFFTFEQALYQARLVMDLHMTTINCTMNTYVFIVFRSTQLFSSLYVWLVVFPSQSCDKLELALKPWIRHLYSVSKVILYSITLKHTNLSLIEMKLERDALKYIIIVILKLCLMVIWFIRI